MKKETRLYKTAMLDCIVSTLDAHRTGICFFDQSSYDKESDMPHLTIDGHKCILWAVEKPNLETGDLRLKVKTGDEVIWLEINAKWLRAATLKRIAYEVYDNFKNKDDWDKFSNEMVSGYLDQFN